MEKEVKTMNCVTATGGTKKQRELVTAIAYYCIDKLMPRHRTLDIEIMLTKTFESGAWGYCYAMDTDREFTVEIDKRIIKFCDESKDFGDGLDAFIETVCHEMVHVMQTAKGLLVDRVYPKKLGYRQLWKGVDHTKTSYSKKPWERQAYRMQAGLLKGFKEYYYG